jgi:DNA modification methylase
MQRESKFLKGWAEPPRNQIFHCDCIEGMARLPEACIPLAVTSAPYDGVFLFGGHPWNFDIFKGVADQLWRVIMPGGVVCWEIKDQHTKNGFTGTKYRQVLYFQELGFQLHEEIFVKNAGITHQINRYPEQVHMVFVLSKGRPRHVHRIQDRPNKTAGSAQSLSRRSPDGRRNVWKSPDGLVPTMGFRTHLWEVATGPNQTTKDDLGGFVAPMAEQLANDLIVSYSTFEDLVLDPFMGTGTTAKMALLNLRHYLGFEIWNEAYETSLKRLKLAQPEYQRRLDQVLVT